MCAPHRSPRTLVAAAVGGSEATVGPCPRGGSEASRPVRLLLACAWSLALVTRMWPRVTHRAHSSEPRRPSCPSRPRQPVPPRDGGHVGEDDFLIRRRRASEAPQPCLDGRRFDLAQLPGSKGWECMQTNRYRTGCQHALCLAGLSGPFRANRDQDWIGQDGADQVVGAGDPRVVGVGVGVDVGRDEPCAICWPRAHSGGDVDQRSLPGWREP